MATPQSAYAAAAGQLADARARYQSSRLQRERDLKSASGGIRKALFIIVLALLLAAGFADVLSTFSVGWTVSWAIPLVSLVIVQRIGTMNRAGEAIAAAHQDAYRQLLVLQQRLGPVLAATGNSHLMTTPAQPTGAAKNSYALTFMRDTAVFQLLELIPVVNWFPFYMAEAIKLIINQNSAYKRASRALPAYAATLAAVDRLEQFEISYLSAA